MPTYRPATSHLPYLRFLMLAVSLAIVWVLATTTGLVHAQTATPDTCVVNCALESCPDGLTDITCFCSSTVAIGTCIQANCTAADVASAITLGQQICGNG